MKNIFLLLTIISSVSLFAQKITKNEIDEFTGDKIKETNWTTLNNKGSFYTYARFRKINDNYYLDFKALIGRVISIDEGENIFLKLENGEILKLYNVKYEISGKGRGSIGLSGSSMMGIFIHCRLTSAQLESLKEFVIIKSRLLTTDNYIEADVKSRQGNNVLDLALIIE
ncbi:MAG: hypothetical protein COB12_07240 [Flavobacterium sp.]|nr:MAG: hypothetical protein COB12_07240 [Flavobacterium sp.]